MAESRACVEWHGASASAPGGLACGDMWMVSTWPDGALVAAIDGLGHGPEAAAAAARAVTTLQATSRQPLIEVIGHCHEALQETRGVVMSLARFDSRHHRLAWIGIGNVSGTLLVADSRRAPTGLLVRQGVVGAKLPRLEAIEVPVSRGDLLLIATDGVHHEVQVGVRRREPLPQAAGRLLAAYNKGSDDALVLLARYRGGTS